MKLGIPDIIDGDWQSVRIALQKLTSLRLGSEATPMWESIKLLGLTASRLVWTDANSTLASKNLVDLVAGTSGILSVADDGDGSITLNVSDLSDPGADRIPFWDETDNKITWASVIGNGLTLSGTNLYWAWLNMESLSDSPDDKSMMVYKGVSAGMEWKVGSDLLDEIGLGTGDSPQFTAIELGHANDTTIARSGAGRISVEGTNVMLVGDAPTAHTHDGDTLQLDGVNSNGGAFSFITSGTVTFSQAIASSGNVKLNTTTHADQTGVIEKNNKRFLYDFSYGDNGAVEIAGYNIFLGEESGNFSMGETGTEVYHGSYNIGIGYKTLEKVTIGYENIAIGSHCLENVTTPSINIGLGCYSLYNVTIGPANIAIGYEAGYSITEGTHNFALGSSSLKFNITGDYNTCIGNFSGYGADGNGTFSNNVFIGYKAGYGARSGADDNIAIGYEADLPSATGSNQLVIGDLLWGNMGGANKLGIGAIPYSCLHVYYPYARTDTTPRSVLLLSSNDYNLSNTLEVKATGHADSQSGRIFQLQTRISTTYLGNLSLQPLGGVVGIGETLPVTQFEMTGTAPYFTLHNSTHEDGDGGRESRIIARGEQSGGEESVLGYMEFAHDGAVDDQKGLWRILLNDGNDGTAPSITAIQLKADGGVFFPNMKSGADQAAAGAAAGELYIDTDDNTIKVGV